MYIRIHIHVYFAILKYFTENQTTKIYKYIIFEVKRIRLFRNRFIIDKNINLMKCIFVRQQGHENTLRNGKVYSTQ